MEKPEPLNELQEKREELLKRRDRFQRVFYTFLAVGVAMLILGPGLAWRFSADGSLSIVPIIFLLYGIMPLTLLPFARVRLRNAEEDLQDLDFQIDLERYEVSPRESRAEKMLRINSLQIRRYHDVNITQNIWVFTLGVFCMLLGVGILAGTLWFIGTYAESLDTKIISGALGAVGTVLVNYIAAIYLRMHATANRNLGDFHSKLVDTYQILFSNLVASRIEDAELRQQTLASVAIAVAKSEPEAKNKSEMTEKANKRLKSNG